MSFTVFVSACLSSRVKHSDMFEFQWVLANIRSEVVWEMPRIRPVLTIGLGLSEVGNSSFPCCLHFLHVTVCVACTRSVQDLTSFILFQVKKTFGVENLAPCGVGVVDLALVDRATKWTPHVRYNREPGLCVCVTHQGRERASTVASFKQPATWKRKANVDLKFDNHNMPKVTFVFAFPGLRAVC